MKNGSNLFDVLTGFYDRAEVCELLKYFFLICRDRSMTKKHNIDLERKDDL